MKKLTTIILGVIMLAACSNPADQVANYQVVPLPHEITLAEGAQPFVLDAKTTIVPAADSLRREAEFLQQYVAELTGRHLAIADDAAANAIRLEASLESENPEAYRITVDADGIVINGATSAGTFYGIQTIRKAIPAKVVKSNVIYPAATISDFPRFGYRGAHLDVVRHPMEVDSVKAFIDMLALHNINRFHWHLTDDQGWRIEIKKYPLLTELGSHRDGTMIRKNFDQFDSIPVDGYYTREQALDIVKYAADRHITIVPEIDLPGHMVAALHAYPHLGCTGGPYDVWKIWGISDDVLCAGNDSVYTFLDDVLSEIAEIFPSEYIHIGGDECPKVRWESCPKCQAKIKELGLRDDANSSAEAKLQSHVMAHAQETLRRYGRRVIGWDEILEGGAPGDAVIMSWRGVAGAQKAVKLGHDAILTPNNYLYFDYYQTDDTTDEPFGIGGYVPVEKVYSLDPTPAEYTPEEAAHIIGVQANIWREYIKTMRHTQYMALPRMAALSEVQWMQPEAKNYDDFLQRVQQLIAHYDAAGYCYARHIFDVKGDVQQDPENRAIVVTLSNLQGLPMYYTTDGTRPTAESTPYTEPVSLTETCAFHAVEIAPDGTSPTGFKVNVNIAKSTFKPYTLQNAPAAQYPDVAAGLTNGIIGPNSFRSNEWVGWHNKDMVATIDLGEKQPISTVTVTTFQDWRSWILDTRGIRVEVSTDGHRFTTVADEQYPASAKDDQQGIIEHTIEFPTVEAQYVRVTAVSEKSMPEWHSAAGRPAYLFATEIAVD